MRPYFIGPNPPAPASGTPALTVKGGSGSGRHDTGTIVKVTADPGRHPGRSLRVGVVILSSLQIHLGASHDGDDALD